MIEIAILAAAILLGWYLAIYGMRADFLPHLINSWQGKALIVIFLFLLFALFKKYNHDNSYDDDAGDAFFAEDDGD